jgi:hypothetical protein
MGGDTTLIAASRHRTTETGEAAPSEIVLISVAPNNTVGIISGGYRGSNVHLKRIPGAYLLAYVGETPNLTRDVHLVTLNHQGLPNGTMDRYAGLKDHAIHNFKLAMSQGGSTFNDLALLWTEPEKVVTGTDADGNDIYRIETSLYAAKIGKPDGDSIYVSYPVKMLTAPEGEHIASYDAHLHTNGLDVKAAVTLADSDLAANIVEVEKTFENNIALTATAYNVTDVQTGADLPVQFTLRNEGYEPISSVDVDVKGNVITTPLRLFPGEEATVDGLLKSIPATFNGEFAYTITPTFETPNSTLRRARLRSAGNALTGNGNVSAVDLSLSLFSNDSTLLLKVVNNSPFALPTGYKVKIGIFSTDTTEHVLDVTKLSGTGSSMLVKIAPSAVSEATMAYASITTYDAASEVVDDKDEGDNFIPIWLYPKKTFQQTLAISTESLRNGKTNQVYARDTLRCDSYDPSLAVTWSVSGLPTGLTLNSASGIISGTPVGDGGDFVLSVTATDTKGVTNTRDVTITITGPSYRVNITEVDGGSITTDRASQAYDAGESVSLIPAAESGYYLGDLSAKWTDSPYTSVSLSPNGSQYTFTMPAADVTITPAFVYSSGATEVETQPEDGLRAWTDQARLYVRGLTPGVSWSVYTVSGIRIYYGTPSASEASITLPARGMYIVRSGNTTIKVVY